MSSKIAHYVAITGHDPYPWQQRLYKCFLDGTVPGSIDVPTGLGKTTCVLLYLLAKAEHAPLPNRLTYIVDRRSIVDQTVEAINEWVNVSGGAIMVH